MKRKIVKPILIILCTLFVLAAGLYGYYKLFMDPYRGTVQVFADSVSMDEIVSGEEAKEDLEYLIGHIRERHPAWLDGSDDLVAAVEAQYEEEVAGIGEEISVLELYQAASRIAAKLHDGHTYVNWYSETQRYIDDFTQIQTYGNPLTIDGVSAEDILEAYKEVASYELDFYVENQFYASAIVSEARLRLCGIDTSDGVVMTFDNDGETIEYTYDFVPVDEIKGFEYNEETQWVSYQIDKENNVGIFTLLSCIDNEEYRSKLDEFFYEVFVEDIQNIVVDLRGNGGGNSWVANEFIKYLDVDQYDSWDNAVRLGWYLVKNDDITYTNQKKEQVFDGEVYILTDISTYSSAMDFAMLIADNDLGAIVGEPSGNLPDSYGDVLSFQLPNSQLVMGISHKRWYRIDQSKSGQPIMPDYEVPAEEALEKVYELIR
uniref:S41 family peptidase n=1 Tax=Acetatifactor sp. TaxID=1872090 RepID=UPI0040561671